MQPASEKCSYLDELICKEDSVEENRFCFNQNEDKLLNSYENSHKRFLMLFAFPDQNHSGFNFSLCLGS